MNQPDFFDVDPETAPQGEPIEQPQAPRALSIIAPMNPPTLGSAGVVVAEVGTSSWTPVPLALFVSWSVPMQLAYCAARDERSAAQERDPEFKAFYLQRAADYRREAGA